jgi:perosamine synthetase
MSKKIIPWATSHYWGNEQSYVLDALQSSWISGGAYVDRFETDFARYCDSPYAVTASNGTTALHMAYLALGIGPGDEVIVPGFGFMAAANIALHVGAKPVFAEVCPESWCVTASAVEKCITSKTKAIVPIHTYGNVCDMDPLLELAEKYSVLVIEDAAESIGSKYKGRMSGALAPIGTYSFHATKTITTGEGGAVITNNVEIRDRMRLFRSHGMSSRRYWHVVAGHNFRLANIHAAIGCAQLERIDDITKERVRVYSLYKKLLSNIDGVTLQFFSESVEPVVWAIAVKLDESAFPQGRDGVIAQLKELGVECRPGFYSADLMPHLYGDISLPVCRELGQQILSLPSGPTLTNEEIEYACENFRLRRK